MSLFRKAALAHHRRGGGGDVLQLTPRALFASYWLLLLVATGALWIGFVGQVDEYAVGPAMVQVEGLVELTAPRAAVVVETLVAPGQRVTEGQELIAMHAAAEAAELETVERELNQQLAKLLRDPADRAAREALVSLRSRRDLARASLSQQRLRAPADGVVGDVRVRGGQVVEPGMPLITLVGEGAGGVVTALLPGQYRPLLAPGQPLRLRLEGFPRDVQELRIEAVGDQIIGPAEAARFIGRASGAGLGQLGPVVLVHARLGASEFESKGQRYRYYHGMQGNAETSVRRDRLAYALVPGLEQVVDNVF